MPAVARILSRYDRERLEGFVAIAIDLMDLMDGDPDLEDDDPAGGNVEDERQMAEGEDYYRLPPRYGIDQTKGPINEIEAYRQHRRDMGCLG
ncbi:hypothetical protein ATN00_00545 [Sphingobium baderi]|uniref:Uncharacterized protein n=2 Tax=Sphingobium baderi TaxID=1332080 RepID=A0A0S3EUE2_9SPHN|nr:hypothetical protein ATN00_00545 [Sphingobium baderi]